MYQGAPANSNLTNTSSAVVEQSTRNPMFDGSNPAAAVTGREQQNIYIKTSCFV
jgi:hypothetical protein